jgi:hypothetical protein
MGLSPPLLFSSSRTLREASAIGGVESPPELSPLLPAPLPLCQYLHSPINFRLTKLPKPSIKLIYWDGSSAISNLTIE